MSLVATIRSVVQLRWGLRSGSRILQFRGGYHSPITGFYSWDQWKDVPEVDLDNQIHNDGIE